MSAAGLFLELRIAARGLRRHPMETLVAAGAFAFGLGLAATLFAVARGAYLRGLPLPDAERIVRLEREHSSGDFGEVRVDEFLAWRQSQRSFDGLFAWAYGNITLRAPGATAHRYTVAYMTPDVFALLGIQPALGRTLLARDGDPGAPPAVLLSDRVFREQFGGDPAALGRAVRLGEQSAQVVGVLPAGMRFPLNQDLWAPLRSERADALAWPVQAAGKLRAEVTAARAGAELTSIARGFDPQAAVRVKPFAGSYTGAVRHTVNLLLAAAVLVLLIACANVSNLLAARAIARGHELAVRAALGASRWRLGAQALAESILVAALGSAGGILLALAGTAWVAHAAREQLWMWWVDLRPDLAMVGFVIELGAGAALLSAALPAWMALRRSPASVLQETGSRLGSRRLGRSARALVTLQVAGSAALLVGSALLLRTLHEASRFDVGEDPGHILTAQLFAPDADGSSLATLVPRIEEVLRAQPEILDVAEASSIPGGGSRLGVIETEPAASTVSDLGAREVRFAVVSPGLLPIFGGRLRAGRAFSAADHAAAPLVVVVNERFAALRFPEAPNSAVGRRVRYSWPGKPRVWRTIVGVVSNTVLGNPADGDPAAVYLPLAQNPSPWLRLVLRTHAAPENLAARLPRLLAQAAPEVPVMNVMSLPEVLADATGEHRLMTGAFGAFAAGAFGLALLGVYGVLAFTVQSRTRELGLRAAVGADARTLFAFVLGQGVRNLLLGLTLGVAAAAAGARLLSAELYGITPWDRVAWVAAFATLLVGGVLACALPAARAARLDPAAALRGD